ncbi:hypothetical protein Tco_1532544 [Tanacetum coccineum]
MSLFVFLFVIPFAITRDVNPPPIPPVIPPMTHNLGEYFLPIHKGFYNTIELPEAANRAIDHAADDKLRDKNTKESWAIIEDLTVYENESWNESCEHIGELRFGLDYDGLLRIVG